ncbi:MAG TPA: PHB depolymerase family esterase [Anaerolineaceae bacterium]|nr:PHB depolymerase family esterase [Anaerolineaceae bacterium]
MKNFLKVLLFILIGNMVIILLGWLIWNLLDRTNGHLISSEEKRDYLLYVPKSYNPSQPVPLVITIHGFAQWPANQAEVSQWNHLADEKGFIVVYPSGLGLPKRWRVMSSPEDPAAVKKEILFYEDLIDKLSADYAIDPTRIFANGLSNGGGMAMKLACDMPEHIAAIGGVAGAYLVDFNNCPGGVPGIFFHGKVDEIVPFEGGPSRSFALPFPNIATFVEDYARLNGCALNETAILDKGHVRGVRYGGCAKGADVVFYTVADGGHTWPGGKPLPAIITGKTTQEVDATQLMWDFFMEQTGNRTR